MRKSCSPYLTGEGRICDNTARNRRNVARHSFNTHYAVRNGTAVLRMYHSQGGETYSYPVRQGSRRSFLRR